MAKIGRAKHKGSLHKKRGGDMTTTKLTSVPSFLQRLVGI